MPVIWKWDRLEKEIGSGHPKSLTQNLFFASLEHCCFDDWAIFHDMCFTDHICSKHLVILNELNWNCSLFHICWVCWVTTVQLLIMRIQTPYYGKCSCKTFLLGLGLPIIWQDVNQTRNSNKILSGSFNKDQKQKLILGFFFLLLILSSNLSILFQLILILLCQIQLALTCLPKLAQILETRCSGYAEVIGLLSCH